MGDVRRLDGVERTLRDLKRSHDDHASTALARIANHTHVESDVTSLVADLAARHQLIGGQIYTTTGTLATATGGTEVQAMTTGGLFLPGSSSFWIEAWVKYDSSVAGDTPILRIRDSNTSGTKRGERLCPKVGTASSSEEVFIRVPYTTTSSAFLSFVLTLARFSGSGSCRAYGDANNPGSITVTMIGSSSALVAV
jgi:hypothetical protein